MKQHKTMKPIENPINSIGTARPLTRKYLPLLATAAFALTTGSSQAALVASFVETFSGGGGSANTSVYTLTSTATSSSFTKEITTVSDGTFFDAANDGYARLDKTVTTSLSPTIRGNYGTIDMSDVGKTVSIDAGFRHVSTLSNTFAIQLNNANVAAGNPQSTLITSSFTSAPANLNVASGTNTLLSAIPSGALNPDRTPGALTYTFVADDVGKTLGLVVNFFEGNGTSNREVLIDSISYSVVPEPSTALLSALGALAMLRRRR